MVNEYFVKILKKREAMFSYLKNPAPTTEESGLLSMAVR